jgi:hypothetical protein
LLVDLVNKLDQLAEAKNEVLERVRERAAPFDARRLRRAIRYYGSVRTKKFFERTLADPALVEKDYWIMHCRELCLKLKQARSLRGAKRSSDPYFLVA